MKYTRATFEMADDIQNVLHTAIETIYPKYYPKEVVDFPLNPHFQLFFSFFSMIS